MTHSEGKVPDPLLPPASGWQGEGVHGGSPSSESLAPDPWSMEPVDPLSQEDEPVPHSAVHPAALLTAVEHVPVGVVVTDHRGRIVFVNHAFTAITGYTFDDVVWKTPRMLQASLRDPAVHTAVGRAIRDKRPWSGEVWSRRKNGELYWQALTVTPITSALGEVEQYVAVLEDATRRKCADERLRLANDAVVAAERARGTFLAGISHEIRTPLAAILGTAQLLQVEPGLSKSQKEKLESIHSAGGHLLGLLDDVLELSRIEAGQVPLRPQVVALPLFLQELDRMFRPLLESRGLWFEVRPHPDLPSHVVTDGGRLRQVLVNLLSNAARYTDRGHVTLSASCQKADGGHSTLEFEVADSGAGIAEHEMELLFHPFARTATGRALRASTGLGLSLSRDCLRLLGGEISLASRVGTGTTVTVTLPVRVVRESEDGDSTRPLVICPVQPGQERARILVADDNVQSRILLIHLLQRAGFETKEACDGEEAVSLCEQWKPDLVLMDLWMPGMDGFEATRRIRARGEGDDIPVIAITAHAFGEGATDAILAGADDFLTLPLRDDEVFSKVCRALGLKSESVPPRDHEWRPRRGSRRCGSSAHADLLRLPPDQVEALREATALLDFEWLGRIADEVEPSAPAVAATVRDLVHRFDHHTLAQLLASEGPPP